MDWFWQVEDVNLVIHPRIKKSRGFGFITMSSLEEADRCIKLLNRSLLKGSYIIVQKV